MNAGQMSHSHRDFSVFAALDVELRMEPSHPVLHRGVA
jgi:hypothetical protein